MRLWCLDCKNSLVILEAVKWISGAALLCYATFTGAKLGLGSVSSISSSFDITQPVGSFFYLGGGLGLEYPSPPLEISILLCITVLGPFSEALQNLLSLTWNGT